MIVTLIVATVLAAPQQTDATTHLKKLGMERFAFNDKVVEYGRDNDYELRMYTMPLSQHIVGYWPLGVSDRRYLFYSMGAQIYRVYYQKIIDGKAETLWQLDIVAGDKEPKYEGTLGLLLHNNGLAPKEPVTKMQRATLSAVKSFAVYHYFGVGGSDLEAWVLRPDGTNGPSLFFDERVEENDRGSYSVYRPQFLPILAEEAKHLGFGDKNWPHNGRTIDGDGWSG